MEIEGEPGEKLQGFSPNVPNPEYFTHVKLIISVVGANMGVPLILVLLDASQTNFSGWRGAVDQAKLGFRRNQETLTNRLHRPVYRWKVRNWGADDPAIAAAASRLGDRIFRHKWQHPSWPFIEPLKDATADVLTLRTGLTSPRRLHASRGRQFEKVFQETIEDNAKQIRLAKETARKINEEIEDGQPVHWRELLSLPAPEGINIAIGAPAGGSQPGQSPEEEPVDAD